MSPTKYNVPSVSSGSGYSRLGDPQGHPTRHFTRLGADKVARATGIVETL